MEETEKGRLWHKATDFPNTFQLTSSELENVARLMRLTTQTKASGSMAELITAQVALICTGFEIMHKENGVLKADIIHVARTIEQDIERFVNEL
jgi:hypothetical protein